MEKRGAKDRGLEVCWTRSLQRGLMGGSQEVEENKEARGPETWRRKLLRQAGADKFW